MTPYFLADCLIEERSAVADAAVTCLEAEHDVIPCSGSMATLAGSKNSLLVMGGDSILGISDVLGVLDHETGVVCNLESPHPADQFSPT